MKKISFSLLLIFLVLNFANAQKVRWSFLVEGSENGAGKPVTLQEGYNAKCAAVEEENKVGKEPKKELKALKLLNITLCLLMLNK